MKNEKITPKNVDTRETRAERVIRLLETTAVDPLQAKLQDFHAFYPAITVARQKGMKTKQIIKILADGGMKLYPALFEKLMNAMENSKGKPCCKLCGQCLAITASGVSKSGDTTCSNEPTPEAPHTVLPHP
ncbi:hypothetical protein I5W35_06780 [Stenotrophomonas maltophilia]|uniref:hypothetical protein n=1 Tax=Stenotrophomonas sp. PS02298 TaxID=2991424 RepID=UPI0018D29F33|nr:hypothetical protein [Stenotrophomonas sp. PS02298]MBH1826825.1 hypothetical protein [Stenotrophomonas maltophilia]